MFYRDKKVVGVFVRFSCRFNKLLDHGAQAFAAGLNDRQWAQQQSITTAQTVGTGVTMVGFKAILHLSTTTSGSFKVARRWAQSTAGRHEQTSSRATNPPAVQQHTLTASMERGRTQIYRQQGRLF
jgi:hypothetical protein